MRSFAYFILFLPVLLTAQDAFRSSHQLQWEFYRDNPELAVPSVPAAPFAKRSDLMKAQSMNKVVYGFHPYWQNGSESNYYFSLLTHLAYFSGDVDAATGNFTSTHNWSTANAVTLAQQYGVKVHFSVTLFSNHATLLGSTSAKNNLINNIMTQINLRGADGCNIDFESISGSQAAAYRDFLKQLGDTLKAHNKEFVVELFAVDWNSVFPASFFSTLDPVVDYYFLMLYDYWYSASTTAGPSAPLLATNSTSYYHVLRSIKAYLNVGCPANKMIAGFPSYGNDWPTVSSARQAATTATSSSRTYTVVKNNYIDTIAASNQFFDATFNTPWYRYVNGGTWRQVWYDDSLSWARKFDSIKVKNVAGTGMWALGYDGAEPELWGAIRNAFASEPNPAHTVFDDFENGSGHFHLYPRYSGTTAGIKSTSSQSVFNNTANNGAHSLEVVLKDSTESSTNWTVRILSGSGAPANNVSFSASGYAGYWLKSASSKTGLQTAISIDDGAGGTLISSKQTIIADNNWHLYQWNLSSTTWSILAGSDTQLNGPNATIDAIMLYATNDPSDWTVYIDDVSRNSSSPLPVELVNFTGAAGSKSVQLNWRTASETDNYGFQVERKEVSGFTVDLKPETSNPEWEHIGFVPGSGTSNTAREYSFTDGSVPAGEYLYRLRQIDRNGAYRYSHELQVTVGAVLKQFRLEQNYPNPFNPSTTLGFTAQVSGMTSLKIYDALGREVATLVNEYLEAGVYHERTFNAGGLASGIYFARLTSSGNNAVRKMFLVK